MRNMIPSLTPNTVLLDDELLPGEIMLDEKVLRRPSTAFVYEIQCPNTVCQQCFLQVTLQRGCFCPHCGYKDPSHKTYKRLVKADG